MRMRFPPTRPDVFFAIADPTRRSLLLRLAKEGERNVTELLAPLRISQPAVSKHLRCLRQAGLVRRRTAGRERLYRIDAGKETLWAWDDAEKDRLVADRNGKQKESDITRFKGLGEMSPAQLKETTMDPRTRTLLKVLIEDELATDKVVNDLMGKDPSARYRFVMESAREADDVDV